jgi:hypothetical protein
MFIGKGVRVIETHFMIEGFSALGLTGVEFIAQNRANPLELLSMRTYLTCF